MGEIIRKTTALGKRNIYDGFSYRLDRARADDKVLDWRYTNTKSKRKARIRTDDTVFMYYMANGWSIHVYPQVTAQNICAESMSRVSEIYRKSCAEMMAFFVLK